MHKEASCLPAVLLAFLLVCMPIFLWSPVLRSCCSGLVHFDGVLMLSSLLFLHAASAAAVAANAELEIILHRSVLTSFMVDKGAA